MTERIYIRAEDEAHAARIAQGAGVLATRDGDGNLITTIPFTGTTGWTPKEADLIAQGVTITPEIQGLLALIPANGWHVAFEPLSVVEYDIESDLTSIIPGAWFGLWIEAPAPAVAILTAQLSLQTWSDDVTKVLVTKADFPTLPDLV